MNHNQTYLAALLAVVILACLMAFIVFNKGVVANSCQGEYSLGALHETN